MIKGGPMLHLKFTPFPRLLTDRLILRQLTTEDADAIFFLRSDASVNQYIARTRATSINEATVFIHNINKGIAENECIYWAITEKIIKA